MVPERTVWISMQYCFYVIQTLSCCQLSKHNKKNYYRGKKKLSLKPKVYIYVTYSTPLPISDK